MVTNTWEERHRASLALYLADNLHRCNIDWDRLARECRDPHCEGDCWHVREVESVLQDLFRS